MSITASSFKSFLNTAGSVTLKAFHSLFRFAIAMSPVVAAGASLVPGGQSVAAGAELAGTIAGAADKALVIVEPTVGETSS